MSDGKSASPFSPVLIGFLPHSHVLRYSQRTMQKGERRALKITAYITGRLKHTHTHTHTHTKQGAKKKLKEKRGEETGGEKRLDRRGGEGRGRKRKGKEKYIFPTKKI